MRGENISRDGGGQGGGVRRLHCERGFFVRVLSGIWGDGEEDIVGGVDETPLYK